MGRYGRGGTREKEIKIKVVIGGRYKVGVERD